MDVEMSDHVLGKLRVRVAGEHHQVIVGHVRLRLDAQRLAMQRSALACNHEHDKISRRAVAAAVD